MSQLGHIAISQLFAAHTPLSAQAADEELETIFRSAARWRQGRIAVGERHNEIGWREIRGDERLELLPGVFEIHRLLCDRGDLRLRRPRPPHIRIGVQRVLDRSHIPPGDDNLAPLLFTTQTRHRLVYSAGC